MYYVNYDPPEPKKLFCVPLTISMLLNAKKAENDCFIDTFNIKNVFFNFNNVKKVILVGRIVGFTECKEFKALFINDNTGIIKIISFGNEISQIVDNFQYFSKFV